MIYVMLEADAQNDWWDDLSEPAQDSIKREIKDAEKGKVTPHKEIMKKYKKRL